MKMKTYIAPTMSEAMDQLRHELGENAILVSTQRLGAGAGVRLTAAIEEEEEDFGFEISDEPKQSAFHEKISRLLESHNTPANVIEKVLLHLKEPVKKTELVSFAAALDATFGGGRQNGHHGQTGDARMPVGTQSRIDLRGHRAGGRGGTAGCVHQYSGYQPD